MSKALLKVLFLVTISSVFLVSPAKRIKATINPVQSGDPGTLSAGANFSGDDLASSSMAIPHTRPTGAVADGFETAASSQEAEVHATKGVDQLLGRGPDSKLYEQFDINGEDLDVAGQDLSSPDAVKEDCAKIATDVAAEADPALEPEKAPEGTSAASAEADTTKSGKKRKQTDWVFATVGVGVYLRAAYGYVQWFFF